MLRAEVYARALRASQNVKGANYIPTIESIQPASTLLSKNSYSAQHQVAGLVMAVQCQVRTSQRTSRDEPYMHRSCPPQLGPQLFVIIFEAVTSRSRSSPILMGWWSVQCNSFRPSDLRW
jgi:hypothetical protein